MSEEWERLGAQSPSQLNDERLQLHWAVQPLAALARAWVEARPDDSHTNLGWDHEAAAFVSRPFGEGHTTALAVNELALRLRAPDGADLAELALAGTTLAHALEWLAEHARLYVDARADGPLSVPDYDLPQHAVGDGRPFDGGDPARRAALARWYATAADALTELHGAHEHGSEARTWPHHFDLGLLIELEPGEDPETARSIGVGMSPGDGGIAQPYYYVNPYPRPDDSRLPELPVGGRWERESFFGAVLTGEALLAGGAAAGRRERVAAFLTAAVDASRGLLA